MLLRRLHMRQVILIDARYTVDVFFSHFDRNCVRDMCILRAYANRTCSVESVQLTKQSTVRVE